MNTPETLQLAHGGGGRLSRDLINNEILPRFGDGPLQDLPDGATLPPCTGSTVFTTDTFVVQPLEFPGGCIGDLAVHGTVNDLAVCGAAPKWMSLALILEEGLSLPVLRRMLDAVVAAARDCEVTVATGDLKVVPKGDCDGIYINTAGIGELLPGFDLGVNRLGAGDHVLVSGTLGDHGMAVMTARENLGIDSGPVSDTGPVHRLVLAVADVAEEVKFMRDPTRGGAAATLNEAVERLPLEIILEEQALPLAPGTRAVAELLGLDPLHVPSEGRVILVCAPSATQAIVDRWREMPEGRAAARVGSITPLVRSKTATGAAPTRGRVVMRTVTGGTRLIDVPRGELLPRIC